MTTARLEPAKPPLRLGAVVVHLPRPRADSRLSRPLGVAERPSLVSPRRDGLPGAAWLAALTHAAVFLAWTYSPPPRLAEPWRDGFTAAIVFDPTEPAAAE